MAPTRDPASTTTTSDPGSYPGLTRSRPSRDEPRPRPGSFGVRPDAMAGASSVSPGRGAGGGLLGALAGLVLGQGLGRVDVAEGRVVGHDLARPGSSTPSRLARMAMMPSAFIAPIPGRARSRRLSSAPSLAVVQTGAGVVAVVGGDRGAQRLDLAGHRAREAMQGRRRPEDGRELLGVGRRDPGRIQVADPALELGRAAERLLDGDLLVEREPDEQGQRVG